MPGQIQSGASSDLLSIDPFGGQRVTPYRTGGVAMFPAYLASYALSFSFQPTTNLGTTQCYFAMRNNGGTATAYIHRIVLSCSFTGSNAVSTSAYELVRYSTATPSGGSNITVVKTDNTNGNATTMTYAQTLNTGLTTTSCVFEGSSHIFSHMNQLVTRGASILEFKNPESMDGEDGKLVLAAGEGLAIRAVIASVVAGTGVAGSIYWMER